MSLFTKENFIHLESSKTDLNLTLFIPTYRANNDEKNRIALKNATKEVEKILTKHEVAEDDLKDIMKPLKELYDQAHFFDHQSDTLAIFMNADIFEYYMLPISAPQMVHSGKDFYLKPLVNFLDEREVAHIMTVSPENVRLLSITDHEVTEHDISDQFPDNLEESHWHTDRNATLQSHGARKSSLHGHGAGKDSKDEDIKRFFRDVKTGLENFFRGEKHAIVLAGVDDTVRLFKETFNYDHFTEDHISGNHDDTHALDLHAEAIEILNSKRDEVIKTEVKDIQNLLHTSRAENSIDEIYRASQHGRIDTLFLLEKATEWKNIESETLAAADAKDNTNEQVDLLNQAAIQTILNGGTVRLLSEDMLGDDIALAHLRH